MQKVVSVAAIKDKQILLVRKRAGWILPGGKLEPDESHQACLEREIREELPDASLEITRFYLTFQGRSTNTLSPVEVMVYFGIFQGDTKKTRREISDSKWLGYDEIKEPDYKISEVTMKILDSLKKEGYF